MALQSFHQVASLQFPLLDELIGRAAEDGSLLLGNGQASDVVVVALQSFQQVAS